YACPGCEPMGGGGRRMLGMLKRHEVAILLKAGHRKTEIARLSGVSLRSVQRIAEESPVLQVDDAAERAKRQIGRPSAVSNFRKQVVGILQEEPDLATLEILRRVRETGYQGGKTAGVMEKLHFHLPKVVLIELGRAGDSHRDSAESGAADLPPRTALVASLRPKSVRPLVRFEGLPGEAPTVAVVSGSACPVSPIPPPPWRRGVPVTRSCA